MNSAATLVTPARGGDYVAAAEESVRATTGGAVLPVRPVSLEEEVVDPKKLEEAASVLSTASIVRIGPNPGERKKLETELVELTVAKLRELVPDGEPRAVRVAQACNVVANTLPRRAVKITGIGTR